MRENLAAADFQLNPQDMAAIDTLDRDEAGRVGPHPDTWEG